MRTFQNSLNIDWSEYEFDGHCPDCDMCRDCGHAHRIGEYHRCDQSPERETVRLVEHPDGYTYSEMVTTPEQRVRALAKYSAVLEQWFQDYLHYVQSISEFVPFQQYPVGKIERLPFDGDTLTLEAKLLANAAKEGVIAKEDLITGGVKIIPERESPEQGNTVTLKPDQPVEYVKQTITIAIPRSPEHDTEE